MEKLLSRYLQKVGGCVILGDLGNLFEVRFFKYLGFYQATLKACPLKIQLSWISHDEVFIISENIFCIPRCTKNWVS